MMHTAHQSPATHRRGTMLILIAASVLFAAPAWQLGLAPSLCPQHWPILVHALG